jgi:DNA processing protein
MACDACLRRSWLLGKLSVRIDCRARNPHQLGELLALDDEHLIAAIGGRRREELAQGHAAFRPCAVSMDGVRTECIHDPGCVIEAADPARPPHALWLLGHGRFSGERQRRVVALDGCSTPTEHGRHLARHLARSLASAKIVIASRLHDGINAASLEGALQARMGTVAIASSGLDVAMRGRHAPLARAVAEQGRLVSATPPGTRPRRWWSWLSAELQAAIAEMVVVVEAEDSELELVCAKAALERHLQVGAVPSRITSPVSRGPHALVRAGATLIRDATDVLDALCLPSATATAGAEAVAPRLRRVLDRIGRGEDTLARLLADGSAGRREGPGEVAMSLAQLEALGLIAQARGGRYVPS